MTFDAALPHCPFAVFDADAVTACPGFHPARDAPVVAPWFHSHVLAAPHVTCAFLSSQPSRLGYVSACSFPEGLPDGAAEAASDVIAIVGRRERVSRRPRNSRR